MHFRIKILDHVATTGKDLSAMENWGLIIYGEAALLYSPNISSDSRKNYAAFLISHELAHMQFGNIVTMEWWNNIWLNEGI